jgi:hypothetical protein
MAETPRERAEQRSQNPEDVRPNPESQSDPPEMPTYAEQHEHEAPGVSAEDVKERIGAQQGASQGEADPGVEGGPAPKTGRTGGFGEGEDTTEGQVGRRPLPGDQT